MIPRILHQVWVGPDAIPDEISGYRETWRRHHPDWEMRLWTEETLPDDLLRKEAYERLRKPAERADIIRLEVLLKFGGVYVDADVECLRPIDRLLEGLDFWATYNRPGSVSNAVLGASRGHPILERAVTRLRPRAEYGLDKWGTGAYFLTKLLREYPEATVFPQQYFNPLTADERERAYAINHHAHSWKEAEEWRPAFLKAERKLGEAERRIDELERWGRRRAAVRVALRRALPARLAPTRASRENR